MKWSANSTLYVDNFGYSEIGRRHKALLLSIKGEKKISSHEEKWQMQISLQQNYNMANSISFIMWRKPYFNKHKKGNIYMLMESNKV